MSLQDDYFDLDAELKGHQRRKLRRIWAAFCQTEEDEMHASECVRLVNAMRRVFADKPPLTIPQSTRKRRKPNPT